MKQIITGNSEGFVLSRYSSGQPARHYRSEVIQAWEKSGLAALPMPYQGVLMDEIRRAAEGAKRAGLMSVPGGQIAGMLGEKNVKPASVILEEMVEEAARILKQMASNYVL